MDRQKVVSAFETVGRIIGELVSDQLGVGREQQVAGEPRSTGPYDLRTVCRIAGIAQRRTLDGHIEVGYFPRNDCGTATRPKWSEDLIARWERWRDERQFRSTYQMWRHSGQDPFCDPTEVRSETEPSS